MRDDEKLEITAGQIRKLAEKYEGVKTAFPEVFEPEWEDVTRGIKTTWRHVPGCGYEINLYCAHSYPHADIKIGSVTLGSLVMEDPLLTEYRAETGINPFNGRTYITILRKKPCPK
jgi:hypothetical protein